MFVNDFDGIVLINLLSEIRLFVWWYFGDSWVVRICMVELLVIVCGNDEGYWFFGYYIEFLIFEF